MNNSFKYCGISGAPGVAIAKVFIVKEISYKIEDYEVTDTEEEIKKVQISTTNIINQLQEQIKITKSTQGEENAQILEAHVEIAKDPTLIEDVKRDINENKSTAVRAVDNTMKKWAKTFSELAHDEYFKEREKDIRDVCGRIIRDLLDVKETDLSQIEEDVIVFAHDFTPSQTAQFNPKFIKGMVAEIGSKTSHTALMAESMKIPALVGVEGILDKVKNEDKVIIFSTLDSAYVIINPTDDDIKEALLELETNKILEQESQKFRGQPSETRDGKQLLLEANIGNVVDAETAFLEDAEGIGLFRTEFLYMENPSELPSEEKQFQAYLEVIKKAKGKPVTIRTLDIGGDKDLESLHLEQEMNPFLGYRAIRISLTKKELFRIQLRALYRASIEGELGIMFPLISNVGELIEAVDFAKSIKEELKDENIKVGDPTLGMMVEIPSTIWMMDIYNKYIDFISVGTNDLVQYSYAVDRTNEKVAHLGNYFDPALIRMLEHMVDKAEDITVCMCGQMAGDALALPILVGLGFEVLSMSPTRILKTRRNLKTFSKKECKKLVAYIVKEAETSTDVINKIKENFKDLK